MENRIHKLIEIFNSVQGEGTKAGSITTFIRYYKCNLACSWCDTKYCQNEKDIKIYTTDDIIKKIIELKSPNVCITGGEPLLNYESLTDILPLLNELPFIQDICIETNGSIPIYNLMKFKKENQLKKVRFIMDYKLPDSRMCNRMYLDNIEGLENSDELKFVVSSVNDFNKALEVINTYNIKSQILFSPVFESMPLDLLVQLMIENQKKSNHLYRLSLQIHKMIWDKETRAV